MALLAHSSPPTGYHGGYLRVELGAPAAAGRVHSRFVPLSSDVLREYLGGSGLGTWLLLHEGAAEQPALAPQACLAFVFSPLVGSPLTTSAKFAVVSKSPLTNRINDSLASSAFAIAGKRTGADAILITGQAPGWSVLVIDEGDTRLESASDLVGLTCQETEAQLRARFGSEFSFAVIGPAGENLVKYATISHDGRHAGRGGSGAVLGSKRLKAIAVRGNQRTPWADQAGLVAYAKDLSTRSFGPATAKYRELGTATNLLVFNRLHALPTRNFQAGSFEGVEAISPESLSVAREKTRASCAACTIGCEHLYSLGNKNGETRQVRLEYENLFALGPLCGISDPDFVLAASRRCDELGLDTISLGGTVAFAMECVERGLLAEPWLQFGSGEALAQAIELISRREGLGARLAEGSRWLSEQIGGEAPAFAAHVKGLELPGYEPRALQTMALGLAVGTRGADHNKSGAYEVDFSEGTDRRHLTPAAVEHAIATEDRAAILDSLILCKFLRGVLTDFYGESAAMLRLVTGWEITADELRQAARRIVTAKKLFNIRAGWTPAEDCLPERFLRESLADDPQARLTSGQLNAAIAAYNLARGWSAEGLP